jgi:hypothetical protein
MKQKEIKLYCMGCEPSVLRLKDFNSLKVFKTKHETTKYENSQSDCPQNLHENENQQITIAHQ